MQEIIELKLDQSQDKFSKNKWEVLLVQSESMKDRKARYWGFPKGHIESGQTTKEAAIREVREEGGVVAEIVDKMGASKYTYTRRTGEKIFKIVTFFLMRYISGDPADHDHEVLGAGWFDI